MSMSMFSGDMFPFSTRYLKIFASALVVRQIWLWYLFSSTHCSYISKNGNDNYNKDNNNSDDSNDNHNNSSAFRTYISMELTYQVRSSLII